MAFIDLYSELTGTIPDLPVELAKRFINRAQRDAFDAWNWSFLVGEGTLNIPDSLEDTGTVYVQQNSPIIRGDAEAAAAWQSLGTFIPITERSIRIGNNKPYNILAFDGVDTVYVDRPFTGEGTFPVAATGTIGFDIVLPADGNTLTVGGQVFTFKTVATLPAHIQIGADAESTAVNATDAINGLTGAALCTGVANGPAVDLTANDTGEDGDTITLSTTDPNVFLVAFSGGVDGTDPVSYRLYKPYYESPVPDLNRWTFVSDPQNQFFIVTGKKQEWLDTLDPSRDSIGGPAQFISFFKYRQAQTIPPFGANTESVSIAPAALWELWPAPTAANSLNVLFKRRGQELVNDDDESPFKDNILIARGLYYAYRFVGVNQVSFGKTTGKVDWNAQKRDANQDFMYELSNEIRMDDNINLASIIPNSRPWFPNSSWLQRHLTWGEYSTAYANFYASM